MCNGQHAGDLDTEKRLSRKTGSVTAHLETEYLIDNGVSDLQIPLSILDYTAFTFTGREAMKCDWHIQLRRSVGADSCVPLVG
jgi:hypothetical protein